MKGTNVIFIFVLFTLTNNCLAQFKGNSIKANSTKIRIKDGWEGKTQYWNHLVKTSSPIIYHLAKNAKNRQVSFYTDIDSISINVSTESDYPLIVILNNSDTCKVILTTKNYQSVSQAKTLSELDTIPFELNENRQIIIKGSINNCPEIDFCFDLGARLVYVIGKNFDKKNKLLIDGLIEDESVTGLSTEKTSSSNNIKLNNLSISNVPVCYIDEAGFIGKGGALIGYNIFQNKILEVDFDKQLLLIHDRLPQKVSSFCEIELKQTTGGLYIPITINNGKRQSKGWYFFDTGADNALTFDSKFAKKERLLNTMTVIGRAGIASTENRIINAEILEVPVVTIGKYQIENIPTLLPAESNAESEFEDGVVGIGLQSKFNFIIDFPGSKLYLKPNKYFIKSFKSNANWNINIIFIIIGVFGVIILCWLFITRTKRKRQKPS